MPKKAFAKIATPRYESNLLQCCFTEKSIGMALMFLLDTNIFLEILLQQEKSATCKAFILKHLEHIYISDFSLHSIGVITFRQHKSSLFQLFTADLLPHIQVLSLPVPL
jgi:hypothetical protein